MTAVHCGELGIKPKQYSSIVYGVMRSVIELSHDKLGTVKLICKNQSGAEVIHKLLQDNLIAVECFNNFNIKPFDIVFISGEYQRSFTIDQLSENYNIKVTLGPDFIVNDKKINGFELRKIEK